MSKQSTGAPVGGHAERERLDDLLRDVEYALRDLGACEDPACTMSGCVRALPRVTAYRSALRTASGGESPGRERLERIREIAEEARSDPGDTSGHFDALRDILELAGAPAAQD